MFLIDVNLGFTLLRTPYGVIDLSMRSSMRMRTWRQRTAVIVHCACGMMQPAGPPAHGHTDGNRTPRLVACLIYAKRNETAPEVESTRQQMCLDACPHASPSTSRPPTPVTGSGALLMCRPRYPGAGCLASNNSPRAPGSLCDADGPMMGVVFPFCLIARNPASAGPGPCKQPEEKAPGAARVGFLKCVTRHGVGL
jgi:hypothetical protein